MQVAGSEFGKQATPGRPWGEGNLHSTVIYDPSCGGNPKRNKKKEEAARSHQSKDNRIIRLAGKTGKQAAPGKFYGPIGVQTVSTASKEEWRREKASSRREGVRHETVNAAVIADSMADRSAAGRVMRLPP